MLKKTLMGGLVVLGLSTGLLGGELKVEMNQLAGTVTSLEMGFFTNDKKATLEAVSTLRQQVKEYLGDEASVKRTLPANLQYKSSIAVNSAEMIEKYASEIEKILNDKNMRMINRQMGTQKAFLEIQSQCFRCHNLVRDWK